MKSKKKEQSQMQEQFQPKRSAPFQKSTNEILRKRNEKINSAISRCIERKRKANSEQRGGVKKNAGQLIPEPKILKQHKKKDAAILNEKKLRLKEILTNFDYDEKRHYVLTLEAIINDKRIPFLEAFVLDSLINLEKKLHENIVGYMGGSGYYAMTRGDYDDEIEDDMV